MRELGLDPSRGGKRSDARRLRLQMQALFRSIISFEYHEGDDSKGRMGWHDMQVAPKAELWWDLQRPDQAGLFGSYIELSESFYNAIKAAPVPVNMKALRALKGSAMALDLYAWATFKTFQVLKKGKAQFVPWRALATQLGSDYGDISNFRKKALASLRKVQVVYPGFDWDQVEGGIMVNPGRLAITEKRKPLKK